MVSNQQARSSARLSSGFRINSAADDAAGLGISETMRAQIRGLDQASRNSQDAISLIQTAEGALSTVNEMVTRIRELVVQSGNDTNTEDDRGRIQDEIDQLTTEINAVATRTEFNTQNLLGGTTSTNGLVDNLRTNIANGIGADNITTAEEAQQFIDLMNNLAELGEVLGVTFGSLDAADLADLDTFLDALDTFVASGSHADADQLEQDLAAIANVSGTLGYTLTADPTDADEAQVLIDFHEKMTEFAAIMAAGPDVASFTFQVGANAGQQITVDIDNMSWDSISGGLEIDLAAAGSEVADLLDALDETLGVVTAQRSELGAVQNRLEFTIENLDIASENLSAAESRIRDADMAKEMMRLTQANVLQQAATSMLAQANQAPQSVLQLLG